MAQVIANGMMYDDQSEEYKSLMAYQNMMPMVNGTQYYAPTDQTPLNQANPELMAQANVPGGITTLPDGRYAVRNDIASEWGRKNAASGDFVQNFLNGPGPVMALGGALGAFGAFGPQGFFGGGNPFSSFGSSMPDFSGATYGNAPGIGGSIMNVGAEGALDTGLGGAYATEGGAMDMFGSGTALEGGAASPWSMPYSPPMPSSGSSLPSNWTPGDFDPRMAAGGLSGLSGLSETLSKAFPNANMGSLLSGGLQGVLGYLGAQQQQKAMQEMQDKWLGLGAPSRARFEGSFQPGFNIFEADPAAKAAATQAADVAARSYSSTSGNPFDNPGAQGGIYNQVLSGVALPQLNTYRSQNLTGGQLGTNIAGTAGLQGAEQAGGGLNAIGYGLGTALNPPTDLQKLLQQYGQTQQSMYPLSSRGY